MTEAQRDFGFSPLVFEEGKYLSYQSEETMKKNLMIIFLCFAIITSCASPTPSPNYEPTAIITLTATVTPSSTLVPSKTLISVPTFNLTEQVVATIVESTLIAKATQSIETQEKLATAQGGFPDICKTDYVSLSPDGNWLTNNCVSENKFLVLSRDGSRKIVVSYEEILELTDHTLMISNVKPLFWTKDSKFLFFTEHICCIDTDAFGWDGGLFRLNLHTGEWSMLISGYSNYFSFSTTGEMLVYIPHDVAGAGMPVTVNVLNIKAWSQKTILLNDYEQAGSLVWKPDDSGFVMTMKTGNYYAGGENFSIVVVNLLNGSSKVIATSSPRFVAPTNWSDKNVITLFESCSVIQIDGCINQFMFYDLSSDIFISPP